MRFGDGHLICAHLLKILLITRNLFFISGNSNGVCKLYFYWLGAPRLPIKRATLTIHALYLRDASRKIEFSIFILHVFCVEISFTKTQANYHIAVVAYAVCPERQVQIKDKTTAVKNSYWCKHNNILL